MSGIGSSIHDASKASDNPAAFRTVIRSAAKEFKSRWSGVGIA